MKWGQLFSFIGLLILSWLLMLHIFYFVKKSIENSLLYSLAWYEIIFSLQWFHETIIQLVIQDCSVTTFQSCYLVKRFSQTDWISVNIALYMLWLGMKVYFDDLIDSSNKFQLVIQGVWNKVICQLVVKGEGHVNSIWPKKLYGTEVYFHTKKQSIYT